MSAIVRVFAEVAWKSWIQLYFCSCCIPGQWNQWCDITVHMEGWVLLLLTAQESRLIFQRSFLKANEPPNMQNVQQAWQKASVDEEETPGWGNGKRKHKEVGSSNRQPWKNMPERAEVMLTQLSKLTRDKGKGLLWVHWLKKWLLKMQIHGSVGQRLLTKDMEKTKVFSDIFALFFTGKVCLHASQPPSRDCGTDANLNQWICTSPWFHKLIINQHCATVLPKMDCLK